jgi:gliding motility-associated lipoprotein GldD
MYKKIIFLIGPVFVLLMACNSPFVPKQKGYSQMHFPEKKYQVLKEQGYPYVFEFPIYAQINKKLNYFGDTKAADNWMNINFPEQNATLYISYRAIQPGQLDTLIKDANIFVNNHNSMANSMQDSVFTTANGISGVFFHIGGNVATNYQFYLTDSTHHFFRAALYFDATPNEDSLAPANAFILKDLEHLVNTFKWQ